MKHIVIFALLVFTSSSIFSQDCQGFISMQLNSILEYQQFNAKGKPESSHKTQITNVTSENGATTITTDNTYYDDKSKEVYKAQQSYTCKDGVITFDMGNMFDAATMSAYQSMEVKMVSDKMDLPANLSEGQALSNGSATMTILNQGVKMMTMTVNVTNRKVEKKESITVAAGTFECYKITYDIESKVMFKVQAKSAEWYCAGIGLVKSESFDSKGKLTGSTELKSYTK
ncbi:MAG: hypothetical protein CVU05_10055 [Bacteroidetes bacterium HGW-Bacteroidetes-21]|jgi:hypothetical protein|nr:MAG: hypothetical protein CVU05_10055 [Bacteroidetes bacterium HGW-Bacteroidetes-21]